ncbi:MAG TPA: hydrogenase maturation protease [Acidimicrobiales bacterium]
MSPVPDRAETLVLGIGNELFTDEGLGVVAARRIADLALPGVEVLDGATLGLALLPEIADRTSVLLLDAVVAGELAPGTVLTLAADQIPMARSIMMSAHQIGVVDALAAAELAGCAPRRLAAVGMVPISLEMGYGLSPDAERGLDEVVDQALCQLAAWDIPVPTRA